MRELDFGMAMVTARFAGREIMKIPSVRKRNGSPKEPLDIQEDLGKRMHGIPLQHKRGIQWFLKQWKRITSKRIQRG